LHIPVGKLFFWGFLGFGRPRFDRESSLVEPDGEAAERANFILSQERCNAKSTHWAVSFL
jgi:hypothetical protein